MPRPITLRQIETFKAFIEHGTVGRAAEMMNVAQPSVSKSLMNFEIDSGLKLFDRHKGRLVPTAEAMSLYEKIDRIYAGIRLVENAIASVRNDSQAQLSVGVLPALGDTFIERVTTAFWGDHPKALLSFRTSGSPWIVEHVLTGELDIGLISDRIDSPRLTSRPLLEHPLVCILPKGHALAERKVIRPSDLHGVPFAALKADFYLGRKIEKIFEAHHVEPKIVLTAAASHTLREFVAAGHCVSLMHPLFIAGFEHRILVRPFEPETPLDFLLCSIKSSRKTALIDDFAAAIEAVGNTIVAQIKQTWL